MKQKIYFITFGDNKYYGALKRIEKQVKNFDIFEKIFIFTNNDLINYPEFWNVHKNFIQNNPRFYGYSIWRPFLLREVFKNMNQNDIIVYSDAGCEWNSKGLERFHEYINILNKSESNILCFKLNQLEKMWTKMDLIKEFNAYDKLNTCQILSGIFFIKKNDKTVTFLQEWYNLMCNYHLIDDSKSILPNDKSFVEHRHDQSCFSLLCKKYNAFTLNDETYYWPWNIKESYINYPILAARNSQEKNIINFN